MITRRVVYLSLWFVLWAIRLEATTYYVGKAGSDANSCATAQTSTTPKLTIGSGVGCLAAGDTLRIKAGTYVETVNDTIPAGTAWGTATIVMADDAANRPLLKPTAASGEGVITFNATNGNQHYIEVNGIDIDVVNISANGVRIGWSNAGAQVADHIRLKNMHITNVVHAVFNGVLVGGGAGNGACGFNELINVEVDQVTPNDNLSQGIYVDSSDNLVDGAYLHDNANNGLQVSTNYAGEHTDRNVIRNSRFINNGTGAMGFGSNLVLCCGDSNQAYNNIVANGAAAGGYGLIIDSFGQAGGPPTNTKIWTNTIYNNPGTGLYVAADNTDTVVQDTIVYSNGTNYFDGGTRTVQDHNLNIPTGTTNPTFVNAGTADFHLLVGSPAMNAGTTISGFSTDFDGNSRPQGSAWDIGAYEFVSATPSSPLHVRIITTPYRLRWDQLTADTVTGFRVCVDTQTGTACPDVGLPTGATVSDTYPNYLSYTYSFPSTGSPGRHSLTVEAYNGSSLSAPSPSPLVVTVTWK